MGYIANHVAVPARPPAKKEPVLDTTPSFLKNLIKKS